MTVAPTFIDVMRHGEPEGICPKGGTILRGSTDHALTKRGWWQAQQRCQSLIDSEDSDSEDSDSERSDCENKNGPWDIIISSPLIRCSDFAKSLVDSLNKEGKLVSPSLFINNKWREINYGDWDGKSTADIWRSQPEIMEKMWQAPLEFCAPNGEHVKDFSLRIEQAWSDLLSEFQGKRILLVCHGGVMRLLLQQLLLMEPEGMNRFAIPYAAMSRFRVDHARDEKNANSDEKSMQHWPSLISHLGNEI